MYLVYNDEREIKTGKPIPYNDLNATGIYVKHFENSMFLKFFLQNGTRIEKQRASIELGLADTKMEYWKKHPNYDSHTVTRRCADIKNNWSMKG